MNVVGMGNIGFKGITPQAGAPFTAGSARNGLSIDATGRVVLGNDAGASLADLLSDRELPLAGFRFTIQQGNPVNGNFAIAPDPNDDTIAYSLGTGNDAFGGFGALTLGPNSVDLQAGNALDSGHVQITNNEVEINHSAAIELRLSNPGVPGIIRATMDTDEMLVLDPGTGVYQLGDINGAGNGLFFSLNDTNEIAALRTTAGEMLSLDQVGQSYYFGDPDHTGNGTYFIMNDGSNKAQIISDNADMLQLDQLQQLYTMGDIGGKAGGAQMIIDDTAGEFIIFNTGSTMNTRINGVPGFTGTVTPVTSITVNGGIVTAVT